MTVPNHADATQLILLLGEIRGDVKGLTTMLRALDTRQDDFEGVTERKIEALQGEISRLKTFQGRVQLFATLAGVLGGASIPVAPKIIALFFGG